MTTYVGAGRWTGGTLSGVFRRNDDSDHSAGAWEQLGGSMIEGVQVQAITVHPDDSNIVFAGARDGLYRSKDAGTHWDKLPVPEGLEVWGVSVHPHNPQILYAGTSPVGVLRSAMNTVSGCAALTHTAWASSMPSFSLSLCRRLRRCGKLSA